MALTKATYSMIAGSHANAIDFGVDNTGGAVFPGAANGAASYVFWDVAGSVLTNANLSGKRFVVSFAYRSA